MQIVLIGHVCIDRNTSEHSSYTNWGSPLMYMSHYFQKDLSIRPTLIAPSGMDFQRYSDAIELVPSPKGAHTLEYRNHTYFHRQRLHRTQSCRHIKSARPVPLTDSLRHKISRADIICLAPLLPNYPLDYVQQLAKIRKPGSLLTLLPQGYLRRTDTAGQITEQPFPDADRIIPLFDLLIFSEDDHSLSHDLALQWAADCRSTHIVVTEGDRGASYVDHTGHFRNVATRAVPENQILDSVGCGDVFGAATMFAYAMKPDIVAAIRAGNKAARSKLFIVGV